MASSDWLYVNAGASSYWSWNRSGDDAGAFCHRSFGNEDRAVPFLLGINAENPMASEEKSCNDMG